MKERSTKVSELIPNEQPEHKQVREMLEVEYGLGHLTVEQCAEFMQEWIETTGGEHGNS